MWDPLNRTSRERYKMLEHVPNGQHSGFLHQSNKHATRHQFFFIKKTQIEKKTIFFVHHKSFEFVQSEAAVCVLSSVSTISRHHHSTRPQHHPSVYLSV